MSLLKAIFKLGLLIVFGAAVAGVVMVVRRQQDESAVSYDEWPDVPENPAPVDHAVVVDKVDEVDA